MGTVQAVGADKFLEEVQGHVVHDGHMVGIPADRAADVEHKFGDEEEEGGNLVGNILRGLVMARIEGVDHLAGSAVTFKEVHGTDGVALETDAEKLGLDAALHAGKVLLEDLVQRLGEDLAVFLAVDGVILLAVMHPDVHDAGVALSLAHRVGYPAAAFGVLDPETADALVRIGQGEVSALGMAERGGVEVKLEVVVLRPLDPALEVFHADLVAIDEFTSEISVDFVEVDAVVARKQGLHEFKVLPDLVNVAGAAGIVAGGLDTSGKSCVAFESHHVVRLPAM